MGWLRKFLGIEPNDHPGLNDGFPPENNYRGTPLMDDIDLACRSVIRDYSRIFEHPLYRRGTSPNVTPIEELENMMQMKDIFLGSGTTFNGPDPDIVDAPPSRPTNPRDQLLKQPDSEIIPNAGDDINSRSLLSSEHLEGNDVHHREALSTLLDRLIIGAFVRREKFSWPPSHDGEKFSEQQPATSPRDAMMKKDTDLDEQTGSSGLDSLLAKESPSYSYSGDGSPRGDPFGRPEGDCGIQGLLSPFPGNDPQVQGSFTSTSISRIVRPDGSIEERRTYCDSSGKEEVTVTEMDPATAGTLLTKDDFFDHNGSGSVLGSIFKSLF